MSPEGTGRESLSGFMVKQGPLGGKQSQRANVPQFSTRRPIARGRQFKPYATTVTRSSHRNGARPSGVPANNALTVTVPAGAACRHRRPLLQPQPRRYN